VNLKTTNSSYKIEIKKIGTTSGGSRNIKTYQMTLPLQFKFRRLMLNYKWKAGRSTQGRIVLWTRQSKKIKYKKPFTNYTFRQKNLSIIAGFVFIPKSNKLISLLFLSSGAITYVPTSVGHKLFELTKMEGLGFGQKRPEKSMGRYYPLSFFTKTFFIIARLPKNKKVSLLESRPGKGVQYVRSTGSCAQILKMDSRIGTSLVKLPSGMKKVFSMYSLGSLGSVALPENKKFTNTSAGFYRNHGVKSQVRGVAMNPVDHPHGGRTKAIKYQRTPWGKTTKFK